MTAGGGYNIGRYDYWDAPVVFYGYQGDCVILPVSYLKGVGR